MIRKLPEFKKPLITPLFGGRTRITRYLGVETGQTFPADQLPPFTELDEASPDGFTDLHLIDRDFQYSSPAQSAQAMLVLVYETLTTTFVREKPDAIDYDLNGLRRVTQELIALPDSTDAFVVDSSTLEEVGQPKLYLAQKKATYPDGATRLVLTYLQAGVISKSRQPGDITGTTQNTWKTWHVDPTNAVDMAAENAGSIIPGTPTAFDTENVQGYDIFVVSTLSGTITGVKGTYTDQIEVRTPGVVTLSTQAVSISGETGTVAVSSHVPPRVKTVNATVTIEIVTTPPNTTPQLAYNLAGISCSVTGTQAAYANLGSDTFTTSGGNASITGRKSRLSIGADIQTYPNSYYVGGPVTGTVTYVGAYQPIPADLDSSSIIMEALENVVKNTLTGTGSTAAGAAEGYYTTGMLQRRVRPVLTDLAGTVYWEVITFSV